MVIGYVVDHILFLSILIWIIKNDRQKLWCYQHLYNVSGCKHKRYFVYLHDTGVLKNSVNIDNHIVIIPLPVKTGQNLIMNLCLAFLGM